MMSSECRVKNITISRKMNQVATVQPTNPTAKTSIFGATADFLKSSVNTLKKTLTPSGNKNSSTTSNTPTSNTPITGGRRKSRRATRKQRKQRKQRKSRRAASRKSRRASRKQRKSRRSCRK